VVIGYCRVSNSEFEPQDLKFKVRTLCRQDFPFNARLAFRLPSMNSRVTIRKAVKEDCPRLLELIRELAAFERVPDGVTVSLQHFEMSGFGEKPVWWALVAEDENKRVVGFALWYIRYSTWRGQRMYLEDIIVTEAFRSKGIGQLLMDALIEEAKQLNLGGLFWQVLDWNAPAIRFYEKYKASFDGEWLNVSLDLKS